MPLDASTPDTLDQCASILRFVFPPGTHAPGGAPIATILGELAALCRAIPAPHVVTLGCELWLTDDGTLVPPWVTRRDSGEGAAGLSDPPPRAILRPGARCAIPAPTNPGGRP